MSGMKGMRMFVITFLYNGMKQGIVVEAMCECQIVKGLRGIFLQVVENTDFNIELLEGVESVVELDSHEQLREIGWEKDWLPYYVHEVSGWDVGSWLFYKSLLDVAREYDDGSEIWSKGML